MSDTAGQTGPTPNWGAQVSANWNRPQNGLVAAPHDGYSTGGPALDVNVWSCSGDVFWGSPNAETMIAPGFYQCGMSARTGAYLNRMNVKLDTLIRLPDPICDMLLAEFVKFWDIETTRKMAERGLAVKRGLILWGPPGSGKTSALALMAQHMVLEKQGVVIVANEPQVTTACIHMFRKIEPARPLVVIYEDLDALVQMHGEAGYLALLDGENQVPGVVNVATTNYPERLDKRFIDRPGRFDRVQFVDMPQEPARIAYFRAKVPDIDEVTLERWVKATHGWSIAHLRELVVARMALDEDEQGIIDRLNQMRDMAADSEKPPEQVMGRKTLSGYNNAKAIGFGRGR